MGFEKNKWYSMEEGRIRVMAQEQTGSVRVEAREILDLSKSRELAPEEILKLIDDGFKFRALKKAEQIKKEMEEVM